MKINKCLENVGQVQGQEWLKSEPYIYINKMVSISVNLILISAFASFVLKRH